MAKHGKGMNLRKNPMDGGFAVFNGHVNGADAYVRRMMRAVCPKYMERVEALEKEGNGIMHIFNVPPEPATTFYAGAIAAIVNLSVRSAALAKDE